MNKNTKIAKELVKIAKELTAYNTEFNPDYGMPEQNFHVELFNEFDPLFDFVSKKHTKMCKMQNDLFKTIEEKKRELEMEYNMSIPNLDKIEQLKYEIGRYEDQYKFFQHMLNKVTNAYNSLNEIKIYE